MRSSKLPSRSIATPGSGSTARSPGASRAASGLVCSYGQPCPHGHEGERYASSGGCVVCAEESARRQREKRAAWKLPSPGTRPTPRARPRQTKPEPVVWWRPGWAPSTGVDRAADAEALKHAKRVRGEPCLAAHPLRGRSVPTGRPAFLLQRRRGFRATRTGPSGKLRCGDASAAIEHAGLAGVAPASLSR